MLVLDVKKTERLVIKGDGTTKIFLKKNDSGLKYVIEAPKSVSITREKIPFVDVEFTRGMRSGNK